jgi:hypothetical protein
VSTSSQTTPVTERVEVVSSIDLLKAADKIRPTNSALADLLDAVQEVEADGMHTATQYPGSDPECVDECPPCVALYAAQVVAAEYLAGAR